jgi:hypothetical protein
VKFERARAIAAAGIAIFTASVAGVTGAEAEETLDPIATVETFLKAMAARDATSASSVVIAEGRFTSVREEAGKRVIRSFSNQEDIASWGLRSESVLERIWSPEVSQHGHMAIVTAPYDFYRNSTFSHCGVDVFELLETESGWRISGGAYTVEKLECPQSPLGRPSFDSKSSAN